MINQPFTKIVVWKKLVARDVGEYMTGSATNVAGLVGTGTAGTGNFVMHSGVLMNWGNNDITNDHIHHCEFNGANSNYWIDAGGAVNGNTGTNNQDGVEIGSYNNGAVHIDAEWMEELCYSRVLTAGERATLLAYLQTSWGL